MNFFQFLVAGLMYASAFYSSGIMAGFHPSKQPNLEIEDIQELKKEDYNTGFYTFGTFLSPLMYIILFIIALTELNIFLVLGTAIFLHPILTHFTRLFLSDKVIADWVILFTVIMLPIWGITEIFS